MVCNLIYRIYITCIIIYISRFDLNVLIEFCDMTAYVIFVSKRNPNLYRIYVTQAVTLNIEIRMWAISKKYLI